MYFEVSEEYEEIVKSDSITAVAKIELVSPEITITGKAENNINSSLQEVYITDNCCDNGTILGTAMAKEVEIRIINKDSLDLADKEFELFVGVKVDEGTYEYVPYGKYKVTDYNDTKSNNIFKLIAYDYMTKFNIEFKEIDFNGTFPMTLKNFKELLITAVGCEFENQNLPNDNFVISNLPSLENYTCRAILGYIAQLQGCFVKINRNNKVQFYPLKNPSEHIEEIDEFSMNTRLDVNKKYGEVNVVSLATKDIEGENVTLRDEESILENGETMITIFDNPFVYSESLKELAITELYNALKGFSYVPVKFKYKARLYTDCGDKARIKNVETNEFVDSIIFNQYIKIPATRQSEINSPALSDTAIKNQYISKTKQANTTTEILVDKLKQIVESTVMRQDGITVQQNQLTQTLEATNNTIKETNEKMEERINNLNITLDGLQQKVSKSGGNNLAYYSTDFWVDEEGNLSNLKEYTDSEIKKISVSGEAYIISLGKSIQTINVPNGDYSISFKYKKINYSAVVTIKINEVEYTLTSIEFNNFQKSIKVDNNVIRIEINSTGYDSAILTDLMVNLGTQAETWTQNPNETRTDTVTIGKGIQVNSSSAKTYTRIDADGNRVYNLYNDEIISEYTAKGIKTQELQSTNAKIDKLRIKKISNQIWIYSI